MTICPGCQTPNREGVRFCKHCGHSLIEVVEDLRTSDTQPIAIRRCSQCGNPTRPDSHFCKVCGAPTSPLSGSQQSTTCTNCGCEIHLASKFCKHCGFELQNKQHVPSEITEPLKIQKNPEKKSLSKPAALCPHCGTLLRAGAKYCRCCGQRVILNQPEYKTVASKIIMDPAPTPSSRFGTGELSPHQIIQERYLIIEKVAQGGMGAVYKAKDERLGGKIVALKEMAETAIHEKDRNDILEAFNREAELLARLNHPSLVRVTDRFQQGSYHYMVMEYIEGKTIAQKIESAKQPFTEKQVLMWAEQICDALHYLHHQEPPIIYRDLKPGNIMVNESTNQIKLIDFGIARFFMQGKTKDTIAFGTEGYAPPEQYGSEQTDVRADIYALGVTLYELLTLHDPAQKMTGFRKVNSINSLVNPQMAAAIEKALQLDRRHRHPNITDMWEAMSGKPAKWRNPALSRLAYKKKR